MADHGLSRVQLDTILDVLAPFADKIDRVGVFGSRATGRARPNSDIDMVLYGDLDEATVDRLWTLFDACGLAIKVDINAFDLITYPPLKEHIEAVAKDLFTKADLLGRARSAPQGM